MNRPHPFRFKRVKRTGRRVYAVVFDYDPARTISTGIAVDPADTPAGGPGYQDAVSWAYANMEHGFRRGITVKEATREMFTPRCAWRRRVVAKGRHFGSSYFSLHRSRLVNYVWPRWGSFEPGKVRPAQIDQWLLELQGVGSGGPLSPEMKNKVLQTLRIALDELEYQGLVDQGKNPARLVPYFTDQQQKREPITMEEFKTLFPEDLDELARIWGDLKWATFFYVMATCGLRPGEVAAIDLSYWIKGVGYPVARSIDPDTRQIKGLKTEEKGVTVKPAFLNDRAESLLTMLVYRARPRRACSSPARTGAECHRRRRTSISRQVARGRAWSSPTGLSTACGTSTRR